MAKEETKEIKKSEVPFNAEQMSIIQQMLAEARDSNRSSNISAISMYNQRDPKSIESVNVKRIDGKFVVGFKNWQKDSFKKKPQYLVYKAMPERGLYKEPYITLLLSEDGVTFDEKEMSLVDYHDEREYYKAKCLNVEVKKVIEDNGYLGSSGEYATAVDDRGMPMARPTILAQVEREERVFTVELPGFEKPQEFIGDYLA